jgi:hypothetical protein
MEHLQTIRYWIIVGSCLLGAATTLFCLGAWFYTSTRWRALFATLDRQFRSLPPFGKLLAIVFLATFIVKGSTKTNNAPPPSPPSGDMVFDGGIQLQPEGGEFTGPRLTTNQYRAGFALVRVATNAAPWFTVPSNAVLHAPWTRYGVAEDTFWLPATNWAFILGTNAVDGLHVSSSGTLSFGWPKGSPRARELPDGSELDFLAPLQTSIGLAPPAGRFWHAQTLSNSLLLTWQDVYANRDTNYPVSFQSEIFWNGDFTFRYDFSTLNPQTPTLPTTNFVVGAQHNGGGETFAFGDTNRLVNGLELRWRAFGLLDPDKDDHDDDGLSTYDEVMIHGTDPRLADSDHDGIDDPDELTAGTDPRNPDADGDGLADGFDPQPTVWNDPNADADNDGYPLWQELFYGTSDAVPGDVAQLLADGARSVTFTISGTPGPGTVLTLAGYPLVLAGRTTFSLDLADGSVIPLALDNAPGVSVAVTSLDCIALTGRAGGLAPGGTDAGTATLVLPVVAIGTGGIVCLHGADQTISAVVTAGLPGTYDWVWNGGGSYGGDSNAIPSSVVPPGWVTARFWPDDGNGSSCEHSVGVVQCHRFYCEHGRPARECDICTGGTTVEWCLDHDEWKCVCACLTMGGGGMLAPGAETDFMIGATEDSCEHHIHYEHCCDCAEHMAWGGWWAEEKTNVIRQISTRLDVLLDNATVAVNTKFICPTLLTARGEQLSVSFGDARVIASHELHASDPVTSSWTVAAIGLEPPTYTAGRYLIRNGTGCVSCVTVLTDSWLAEGSLRLDAGSGGLRFSATEGAPWAGAQALRNDTPPASVGASRDFWLGASAGGSHTLSYSLRTPQGAACLSTNLAIEAIVAKFATNVYYAAHGDTGGILVALSSASHDPAGFTLKLDGAVCAEGQPPWQVAVSNLAAGAHTLTVQSETFPDLADEAALIVAKVDYLEASSDKADNSPQQFPGHQAWPFVPTNWSDPGRHLVVFFKDTVDANLNVLNFDIDLTAHLLPAGMSHVGLEESWRMISGSQSGILNRSDSFAVKYQNPKQGGVYKIGFNLGLDRSVESEANIVLPLAGAEIDHIMRADITRADAFATRVLATYTAWEINYPPNGFEWFVAVGHGDYLGRPNNASSPTVRKYNQVDDEGKGAVATWCGVPVKIAKASNFIVAYACRRIDVKSFLAWGAQLIGTKNDASGQKSWDAGWAVGGGADYGNAASNLVVDIWDEHKNDDKNQKLWPNHAPADNYVAPPFFFGEQDVRFTSPGFLYMTTPERSTP